MGKASQKKKAAREARADTPDLRLTEKRCLHCGAKRDIQAVWCEACTLAGRRRARFRGWPIYNGLTITATQIEAACALTTDKRWDWQGLVDGDLSYYDPTDPASDPSEAPGSS